MRDLQLRLRRLTHPTVFARFLSRCRFFFFPLSCWVLFLLNSTRYSEMCRHVLSTYLMDAYKHFSGNPIPSCVTLGSSIRPPVRRFVVKFVNAEEIAVCEAWRHVDRRTSTIWAASYDMKVSLFCAPAHSLNTVNLTQILISKEAAPA